MDDNKSIGNLNPMDENTKISLEPIHIGVCAYVDCCLYRTKKLCESFYVQDYILCSDFFKTLVIHNRLINVDKIDFVSNPTHPFCLL